MRKAINWTGIVILLGFWTLAILGTYQLGVMDGRSELEDWFRDTDVVRFHCPDAD